ncbi:MAG: hypothetical protein AAF730_02090 [Bacteroidota bacterium]
MMHAFHIHPPRAEVAVACGRWRIRYLLRPRARWWVRQSARSTPNPPTAPRGGLAVVLRDGPAAHGYPEGLWQWNDLMAYAQRVWGTEVTPQMLHHRLRALGYASDGRHVIRQPGGASQHLAEKA